METLRIFVSSPGDVAAERAAVRQVLDELEGSHLLRDKVNFQLVAWDDPYAASPMAAGVTPQDSVNRYSGRPSGCDLTLVILWSRIGTVLPPDIVRADGSRYASGTVWEFEDASNAHRPVWLYRCTSTPQIAIDDADFDAKRSQYAAVNTFFSAFKNADGSLGSGVNSYAEPADFARQLRQHLEAFVNERLSRAKPSTPKNVLKPVLRIPQRTIVGRDKLVKKVVAGLEAGQQDFAFVYLPGVGKTAVAAELLRTPAIMQRFPDGVLWAHLGQDAQDAEVHRQLAKWAKSLGLSREDIAACTGTRELSEAVVQAIGEASILLVVDDIWTTEVGQWFMIGGPNCARVITTRYQAIARDLMSTVDGVLKVDKLSPEEGFELLTCLVAPNAAKYAPQALRQLVTRVDGLPMALVLIGKMLIQEGANEQAARTVLETLTNISKVFHQKKSLEYAEDHNFSLGEVVEASYSALGAAGPLNRDGVSGEQLRSALDALSVLRPDPAWFPIALARLVTGAPDPVLKAVVNAGLIEGVRYPGDAARADDGMRYTMHRMIAEYVRTKLAPTRLQALNHLAADYYLTQLAALEKAYQEGDATSYSIMYRYEDPEWQDSQDNWLYYFAQTGYDREANFSFLQTWFGGFWWWSCFTAEGYDFCDELLNDWDARLSLSASASASSPALNSDRIERLMHVLELLRNFKRAYPKETEEDRSGGAWSEVKATLNELRQRTGLDCDVAQLTNAHARHVRALTNIFLAEAERFGEGDSAFAETFYREALALFREAKDDWNVAWVSYHLADMLTIGGRHEDARPLALEAREVGRAVRDPEVVALAHRLLGDIAFAGSSASDALRHYQRAVESAYRFQVQPKEPDAYTLQFYAEFAEAVAGRLLTNYPTRPAVQQIAETIRQAWLTCGAELAGVPKEGLILTGIGMEELAKQLFPPSLPPGRPKADTDAYAARVRAHLAAINTTET